VNAHRSQLVLVLSLSFLLLLVEVPLQGNQPCVGAYTPSAGHWTLYDYGFINTLPNLTADDIRYWTARNLTGSGYTLRWHQYVNLSIAVAAVALVANVWRVLYDFSVVIHSNLATVSNSSWQMAIPLNGSALPPAPTGVSSGVVDLPVCEGLAGFFLDDLTLTTLHAGTNVNIGGSLWQSIALTTFTLNGLDEACYQLHNVTTAVNASIETTYRIDRDAGIYFWANETRTLTIAGLNRTLTYYYTVLESTVPLVPPANPLPFLLVVVVGAIVLAVVVTLFARALWLRRRRSRLPPLLETTR
jgi:hypothetical protein